MLESGVRLAAPPALPSDCASTALISSELMWTSGLESRALCPVQLGVALGGRARLRLLRGLLEVRHFLVERLRMFRDGSRSLRMRYRRRFLQHQNNRDQRRHQGCDADDAVDLEFLHSLSSGRRQASHIMVAGDGGG